LVEENPSMKRVAAAGLVLVLSAGLLAALGADNGAAGLRTLRVSVSGTRVVEGDSSSVNAVFVVRLSSPSSHRVSVRIATADDSASAGSDYQARHAVIRLQPGQRTARFAVPVIGDALPEQSESFFVALSHPRGARLGRHRVAAVIPENDLPAPFQVTSTLTGADEVEENRSPTGHGQLMATLDAARRRITFTLSVTGMALGDSGILRGQPMRPTTEMLMRLGDPTGPGVNEGVRQFPLKSILDIYKAPASFCARATTPTRGEFIRGQLARG
jgi:hypothetical protein